MSYRSSIFSTFTYHIGCLMLIQDRFFFDQYFFKSAMFKCPVRKISFEGYAIVIHQKHSLFFISFQIQIIPATDSSSKVRHDDIKSAQRQAASGNLLLQYSLNQKGYCVGTLIFPPQLKMSRLRNFTKDSLLPPIGFRDAVVQKDLDNCFVATIRYVSSLGIT